MREEELVETLRMTALPESSDDYLTLLEFLKLYRDPTQFVVNKLWSLNKVPSISTLHGMFYSELRKHGFRAHHVKQICTYAKAVVKACKRNIINLSEIREQVKDSSGRVLKCTRYGFHRG